MRRPFLPLSILILSAVFFASCSRRASPPKPYLAFIAARGSHFVTVVNLACFERLRTISLPFQPLKIFVPHTRQLAVTSAEGKLAVISFPSLQVTKIINVGAGSLDVALGQGRAYVLHSADQKVSVFEIPEWRLTQQFTLSSPLTHIALTSDGKTLIGEDTAKPGLEFISSATGDLLGSVTLTAKPGSMVILPKGFKLFVADQGQNTVTAVDVASRAILSRIEIARPATLLALKPDGGEIFAFSAASSTILDTFHDSVEQNLPAGKDPVAAVFTADSSALYVANAGAGTVTSINVANRNVIASTSIGVQLGDLTLTPDERFLVVTDQAAGSLAVMRTQPPGLLTTISVGPDPTDVVVPDWLWEK